METKTKHTPGQQFFEYPLGSLKKGDITKDYGVVISRRRNAGAQSRLTEPRHGWYCAARVALCAIST